VHRIKNTLAMAQAVVSATLRNAQDLPSARRDILARLSVLAVTQPALIEGRLAPSDVALIAMAVMKLHIDLFGRVTMEGPSAEIEPAAAQGLALILHELATNAVRYGALSRDDGALSLTWSVITTENRVELLWHESGGPAVRQPDRKGFGTTLIERALPRTRGNRVDLFFAPAGVQCRISLALRAPADPGKGGRVQPDHLFKIGIVAGQACQRARLDPRQIGQLRRKVLRWRLCGQGVMIDR
jgi:two-component sensor histidine kinase